MLDTPIQILTWLHAWVSQRNYFHTKHGRLTKEEGLCAVHLLVLITFVTSWKKLTNLRCGITLIMSPSLALCINHPLMRRSIVLSLPLYTVVPVPLFQLHHVRQPRLILNVGQVDSAAISKNATNSSNCYAFLAPWTMQQQIGKNLSVVTMWTKPKQIQQLALSLALFANIRQCKLGVITRRVCREG